MRCNSITRWTTTMPTSSRATMALACKATQYHDILTSKHLVREESICNDEGGDNEIISILAYMIK